MIQRIFFTAAMMLAAVSTGTAGTIANGAWTPSACGTQPEAPAIEQGSIEDYNQSIKAINEWQRKVNAYNTCLVNEANTDSALIANIANKEQSRLRAAMEKIRIDTDAAKVKLDSK
jgi:hypothetical protein